LPAIPSKQHGGGASSQVKDQTSTIGHYTSSGVLGQMQRLQPTGKLGCIYDGNTKEEKLDVKYVPCLVNLTIPKVSTADSTMKQTSTIVKLIPSTSSIPSRLDIPSSQGQNVELNSVTSKISPKASTTDSNMKQQIKTIVLKTAVPSILSFPSQLVIPSPPYPVHSLVAASSCPSPQQGNA